jgi:hypothetical protein
LQAYEHAIAENITALIEQIQAAGSKLHALWHQILLETPPQRW